MSIAFKKEDICPALVDFSIKFGVLPTRFVREVVLFCIVLRCLGIKKEPQEDSHGFFAHKFLR